MVPEDLVFWLSVPGDAPSSDPDVLCRRHADAMVVPRGWTLDDRRESALRLFKPAPVADVERPARSVRRRRTRDDAPEQLQIDGTGETTRPEPADVDAPGPDCEAPAESWSPRFDQTDDLGGLLEVDSPLLSRAFRGTGRNR